MPDFIYIHLSKHNPPLYPSSACTSAPPLPPLRPDDCLRATLEFLEAPAASLLGRTYNINATSFTPRDLVREIQKGLPDLEVTYNVDPIRQAIGEVRRSQRCLRFTTAAAPGGFTECVPVSRVCSGRLADGVGGHRGAAGLGLEARVRPLRVGADHADSHRYGQPAGTNLLSLL